LATSAQSYARMPKAWIHPLPPAVPSRTSAPNALTSAACPQTKRTSTGCRFFGLLSDRVCTVLSLQPPTIRPATSHASRIWKRTPQFPVRMQIRRQSPLPQWQLRCSRRCTSFPHPFLEGYEHFAAPMRKASGFPEAIACRKSSPAAIFSDRYCRNVSAQARKLPARPAEPGDTNKRWRGCGPSNTSPKG